MVGEPDIKMAAQVDDRLKPAVQNEGVAENANTKNTTDPSSATARPEFSRNAPPSSSLPLGEKRKAPSSPEDGGQKKSKPFAMSFGTRPQAGGAVAQGKKDGSKSVGLSKPLDGVTSVRSVSLKLMQKPKEPELKMATSRAVAKAFAEDSDDDEEEMPPEAKMRMKNVGRETPTSAGPNSYNKSKYGFNDHARVWRKGVDKKVSNVEGHKK